MHATTVFRVCNIHKFFCNRKWHRRLGDVSRLHQEKRCAQSGSILFARIIIIQRATVAQQMPIICPIWNLSSRRRTSSGHKWIDSQYAITFAKVFFVGWRMKLINARSFGSLMRLEAWSSKQSGVLQKSFIAIWYSGG